MRTLTIASLFSLIAMPAFAADYNAAMESYLETNIRNWAQTPVLVEAIANQNSETSGMSQADVDALDLQWRAEVGTDQSALISDVLSNDAADFLRTQIESSGGRITEIFIMDAQGLNVAASGTTSDMWQGDEAKFQMTYSVGSDAVHFGEIELDESSQRYQAQISLTIVDTESGAAIGAMTVGVDADSLM
ncbi:hypothetical protein [Pseudophaeobacter sp.]|jgi:hypothetical protein|uniref:hypothetical protein n=1 Tax=unclassified Pseudophaeobacter TaxID=2637024 RepID=UPI0032638105